MNLHQFCELKIKDVVGIQGNTKDRGCFGTIRQLGVKGAMVEIDPGETKLFSYKSLKVIVDLEKESTPTESDVKKDSLSKDDLISVVKTLLTIRANYEKKFGIIMYADGTTRKIEKMTSPLSDHNYAKERGASKYKVRNIAIKKMRDSGATYKDIGLKYGVSISQCRSIVILEARNEKNGYR